MTYLTSLIRDKTHKLKKKWEEKKKNSKRDKTQKLKL